MKEPSKPGPLDALVSVFRAWFGVQSEAARERDFNQGDARTFIIAGVLFTLLMVTTVAIITRSVLP